MKMWTLNLRYVDRNSWTNYNAIYTIAAAENENNSKFLMRDSTLRSLIRQRIALNKKVDEINDQSDELSDVEYI